VLSLEEVAVRLNTLKTAYSDGCVPQAQVYHWYSQFKEGREDCEDETSSGRPVVMRTWEMVVHVHCLVSEDCCKEFNGSNQTFSDDCCKEFNESDQTFMTGFYCMTMHLCILC
jgi:hypothetical protein